MSERVVTIYSEWEGITIKREVYQHGKKLKPLQTVTSRNCTAVDCPFCTTVQGVRKCPLCGGSGKILAGYPFGNRVDGVFDISPGKFEIEEVWLDQDGNIIREHKSAHFESEKPS